MLQMQQRGRINKKKFRQVTKAAISVKKAGKQDE